MPILLLIDTCIWKRLVSKSDYSFHLRQLEEWVRRNEITLLIPPQVKKEWIKHREEEKKNIQNRIAKAEKEIRISKMLHHQHVKIDVEVAEKRLLAQIESIDELIANGLQVEDYEPVILLTYRLKQAGAPPFAIKKASDDDSMMLFNTMHYLSESSSQFYFASANTDEFSDLNDKQKFHLLLQAEYPNVQVHYFIEPRSLFLHLQQSGLSVVLAEEKKTQSTKEVFHINKTAPLVDQLYQYMEIVLHEWSFLPLRFFTEQYPFILNSGTGFIRKAFTLHTDNKPLYDLLTSIRIEDGKQYVTNLEWLDGIDNSEMKLKAIIVNLSHNLVHYIKRDNDRSERNFFYFNYGKAEGLLAKYVGFDYVDLIASKEEPTDDSYVLLQKAYVKYQLGFYREAAMICQSAATKAEKEPRRILQYIATHNQVKSIRFLDSHYWGKDSQDILIDELKRVDLGKMFEYTRTEENERILSWLHTGNFFNEAVADIHELVTKIRKLYYTKSTGFSSDFSDMKFSFYQLSGFLTYNCIFHEHFAEFNRLSSIFLEGVMASYGCSDNLGGKLHTFTDDLLFLLVRYCSFEDIQHQVRRYKVTSIRYWDNGERAGFNPVFKRFMSQHEAVWRACDDSEHVPAMTFIDQYYGRFNSFLTLCSYLELSERIVEELAESLLAFIQFDHGQKSFHLVRVVANFMDLKGSQLSVGMLTRYFHCCVLNEQLNDETLVYQITEHLLDKKEKVSVSDGQFGQFKSIYFGKMSLRTGEERVGLIGFYFSVLKSKSYKQRISEYLQEMLNEKFDLRLFYQAAIGKLIQPTADQVAAYHDEMKAYILSAKDPGFSFNRTYFTNSTIDSYLNFVFREDYLLPDQILQVLSDLSPYYKWLVNIDSFDYTQFDYRWLYNHWTIYYRARYRRSIALKKHLLEFLRETPRSEAQGVFINIYHSR